MLPEYCSGDYCLWRGFLSDLGVLMLWFSSCHCWKRVGGEGGGGSGDWHVSQVSWEGRDSSWCSGV